MIPPDSPAATLVSLILSNKEVFPWSTCPIITTIGGRLTAPLPGFFLSFLNFCPRVSLLEILNPKSSAMMLAVSKSISSLTLAKTPFLISSEINSVAETSIFSAKFLIATKSPISISVFSFWSSGDTISSFSTLSPLVFLLLSFIK